MGFPIASPFDQETADKLLSDALAEPNRLIDTTGPIEAQVEGWKAVIDRYGDNSMFDYLRNYYNAKGVDRGDQEDLISYIGTLQNLTSRLMLSFIHSFVDTFFISPTASYVEIPGGNWQLPYAFLPELEENLVMDARAIEIQWSDGVNPGGPKAVHRGRPGVYVRTLNGARGQARRGTQRASAGGAGVHRRLHGGDHPLQRPALRERRAAVQLSQAPRHHRAALRQRHQGAAGVQRALLGVERGRVAAQHGRARVPRPRQHRGRLGDGRAQPVHVLPVARRRGAPAAWCSPATPGPTTPRGGTRSDDDSATPTPCAGW